MLPKSPPRITITDNSDEQPQPTGIQDNTNRSLVTFSGWKNYKPIINPQVIRSWNILNGVQQEEHLLNICISSPDSIAIDAVDPASLEKFCETIGKELGQPIRKIQQRYFKRAASHLRSAAQKDNSRAIYFLAFMIQRNKITASQKDFDAAKINMPNAKNNNVQAAVLFRRAIELGNTMAIHSLAWMISKGRVVAEEADFVAAGIAMPRKDKHAKAAALYRKAIKLGNKFSINNLAAMILMGHIVAEEADFVAAGIARPEGGNKAQATVLLFSAAIRDRKNQQSFVDAFSELEDKDQRACIASMVFYLVTTPKEAIPENLFEFLLERQSYIGTRREFICEYLESKQGIKKCQANKEKLLDNSTVLGYINNYQGALFSTEGTLTKPGTTMRSTSIIRYHNITKVSSPTGAFFSVTEGVTIAATVVTPTKTYDNPDIGKNQRFDCV